MKRPRILLVFFTFVHLAVTSALGEPKGTQIIHMPTTLHPSSEVAEQWLQNALNYDEIWHFFQQDHLLELLKKYSIPLPPKSVLNQIPSEGEFFIVVGSELKAQLSRAFFREVYSYQIRYGNPSLEVISFPNTSALRTFIDNAHLPQEKAEALVKNHIYQTGLNYYLPITPDLKPLMEEGLQQELIQLIRVQNDHNRGRRVLFIVEPGASPKEIADYFRALRSPRAMEKVMKVLVQESGSLVATDLQNVLSTPIKNNAGTFAPCDGPNCYYTAVSSHPRSRVPFGHLPTRRFVRILNDRYTEVSTPEQPGDLIVLSEKGEPVHSAVFIMDIEDGFLVYEKQGKYRQLPFTFTTSSKVNRRHGNRNGLELSFHRANDCIDAMEGLVN